MKGTVLRLSCVEACGAGEDEGSHDKAPAAHTKTHIGAQPHEDTRRTAARRTADAHARGGARGKMRIRGAHHRIRGAQPRATHKGS